MATLLFLQVLGCRMEVYFELVGLLRVMRSTVFLNQQLLCKTVRVLTLSHLLLLPGLGNVSLAGFLGERDRAGVLLLLDVDVLGRAVRHTMRLLELVLMLLQASLRLLIITVRLHHLI